MQSSKEMTTTLRAEADVVLVGAGTVGLFLACRLEQLGLSWLLLEREKERLEHSRAIGLHPPSLEFLQTLGRVDSFLERGVVVPAGVVLGRWPLGRLSFTDTCRKPYNFVLSLPQHDTEAILEEYLQRHCPQRLWRGATVQHVTEEKQGVQVQGEKKDKTPFVVTSPFVVGCDGMHSLVRKEADIAFEGSPYEDSFVMGDFSDNTSFGREARIFLSSEGLVESFPLPRGRRRWVLRMEEPRSASTDKPRPTPKEETFRQKVRERTGHDLSGQTCYMISPFGIQHYLAAHFVRGRLLLAGDAAHVMSPIGGQGMNVGWMDAWDLADALQAILTQGEDYTARFACYEQRARRRARKAIQRAAFNTRAGRKTRLAPLRDLLIALLLHSPARYALAYLFTMRGL